MKEFTKIMILGGLAYIGGSSAGMIGTVVGAVVAVSVFYLIEDLSRKEKSGHEQKGT